MVYKAVYTNTAESDLRKIGSSNAKRVVKKVDEYVRTGNPLKYALKLKNTREDYYRFRVGDYRAIFGIDAQNGCVVILVVLRVAHRKEVYRKT